MTNAVDLSRLPRPDVIPQLDVETIIAEMRADLIARRPDLEFVLEAEGQVLTKLIEAAAYRELLVRAAANDQAKGGLLAFAHGSTLDHIAALIGAERRVIATDDDGPVYEDDDEFRRRIPMTLETFTSAGTKGAYQALALEADGDVIDAVATNPEPGVVDLFILSRNGSGEPTASTIQNVRNYLDDDRRPLCDTVNVRAAVIVPFVVEASITVQPGPDASLIVSAARASLHTYLDRQRRLGYDISRSMLYAAIGQEGITRIDLRSPAGDISLGPEAAAYCTGINITVAQRDV